MKHSMTSRVREIDWVPERCIVRDNGEFAMTGTPSAISTSGPHLVATVNTCTFKPMTLDGEVSASHSGL